MKNNKDIVVKIGMGSCGIASGAEEIYNLFIKEFERRSLNGIIKKVGCIGNCYAEPLVEVFVKNMPPVMYGNVDNKLVYKIIDNHIIKNQIMDDHIFDFIYKSALEEK